MDKQEKIRLILLELDKFDDFCREAWRHEFDELKWSFYKDRCRAVRHELIDLLEDLL